MSSCAQCSAENAEGTRFCRECGAELDGPDPLLGQEVLGRYRVSALLGEGGMGRVYVAEQRVGTTTRRVAVKTLRPQLSADKQLARRFFREAETIVRLTHPNTIQFFDFGELPDGTLVIVMELIEGRSLAAELSRGALSPERADRILAQICGALSEAHALGIVHRDLKPDNILLTERGGQRDFVKVLDFGIAKISTAEDDKSTKLTQQGMMIGTPPYMSPEQFSGEAIDARSDIYSLGVIAYEMLTGKLPFMAKTPWEWASKHLTAEPEPLRVDEASGISERRSAAIRRALAKAREQRPATVEELLAEFTASGAPTLREAQPAPPSAPPSRTAPVLPTPVHVPSDAGGGVTLPLTRRPKWLAPAALGAVLLVGVAALWLRGQGGSNPSTPPAPPAVAPQATAAASALPPVSVPTAPELPHAAPAPSTSSGAKGQVELPHASGDAVGPSSPARRAERHRSARSGEAPRDGELPTSPPAAPKSAPPKASEPAVAAPAAPVAALPAPPAPKPASTTPPAPTATPADLADRISRARASLDDRLESSVAMYQAAARKYGQHPALDGLHRDIEKRSEAYVRKLVAASRCAQAQALFRALKAISAAPDPQRAFGSGCAAP